MTRPPPRAIRARGLREPVPVTVHGGEGPLLVVHDGPQYEREAAITALLGRAVRAGRLPRHRVALLAAPDRDEWYSASARYARALAEDVVPAVGGTRPVVLGSSLGALAALHAHRRAPGAFAGLVLQSGSFFVPRLDGQEAGFPRFGRIVRFVRATARGDAPAPVPVTMTCGVDEENRPNNRAMAAVLRSQGYPVVLHEVPGGHDFGSWRAALDAHLVASLRAVWVEEP